jgi:hypothetical protein
MVTCVLFNHRERSSPSNAPPAEVNGIRYDTYQDESQMQAIMELFAKDLSEPYSIYTYRYFINNWPRLCVLVPRPVCASMRVRARCLCPRWSDTDIVCGRHSTPAPTEWWAASCASWTTTGEATEGTLPCLPWRTATERRASVHTPFFLRLSCSRKVRSADRARVVLRW